MPYHIAFEEMEWETKADGRKQKVYAQDGKQIRVLEITTEFEEAGWCTKGHLGYILEGVMELEFEDQTILFREGDGFFIPGGPADHHRTRAITPRVRMVIVEDAAGKSEN